MAQLTTTTLAHSGLSALRGVGPVVLPSMLLCNFGNLEREIRRLEDAGVRGLHLDVMDGAFVPNLTYGFPIVEACRRLTPLPLDVHLMIDRPGRYLAQFAAAGANCQTIHIEAAPNPRELLGKIRSLGCSAGLALNPATPLGDVEEFLDACDLLLVMSVSPGFGGQAFEPVALEKLRRLREIAPADVLLEVDGGVNDETIGACAAAGAQLFVTGSAIFKHADYAARAAELTRLAKPHGDA